MRFVEMKPTTWTRRRWASEEPCPPEGDGAPVVSGPRRDDEAGAVLVLALLFLVVVGMLVGGLASWTANDLRNTLSFQQDRSAHYALTSATQVAIQSIRYTPLLGAGQTQNASPPSYCWGTSGDSYGGSELTTQNDAVETYCSTVYTPTSAATRVVTISACLQSLLPTGTPAAPTACAQTPGLQTVVTFDDYYSGNPTANQGQCVTSCGNGMTINSSISKTTAPTVTGLSSPVTGLPVTGGPAYPVAPNNTLTLTGTGFVAGSTTQNSVTFVAIPASVNVIIPATVTAAPSSTSLTITIPPTTTVTPSGFYVIVTTPNGSSSAGPANTYTYQNVIPTISNIVTATGGASGSAAGGTSIVITGTGFLSNSANSTKVDLVDTTNASNVLPVANLTVNSATSITATTPPDPLSDLTFYVRVTTSPGGQSTTVGAPVFTFQLLNPVVGGVSPSSGGSQTITITGVGFVTGATTVKLVPTTGTTLTATNPTVSNSTTMTATVPTGGVTGKVYAVEVTTSGGNSGTGSVANQYTY